MKEEVFRKKLVKELRYRNFPVKYMSSMNSPGIPDVYMTFFGGRAGWLELKSVEAQPKSRRKHTNILGHKFTGPQLEFLKEQRAAGAFAAGLLSVGPDEFYVLNPVTDITVKGGVSLDMLAGIQKCGGMSELCDLIIGLGASRREVSVHDG